MSVLQTYRLFIDGHFPEPSIGPSGALVMGIGNSSAPALSSASGGKFFSLYTKNSNAGDAGYNMYLRHYISGVAGDGIALRAFGTVSDVAAANARGAHISLSFGTSGTVSGLGVALECTLHIPNSATQAGSIAPLKVAINSDGATSDTAGATNVSYIRFDNQGNATGGADVDDDAYLFSIFGHTEGAGNMIVASTTEANYAHAAKCYIDGIGAVWLMFASASG